MLRRSGIVVVLLALACGSKGAEEKAPAPFADGAAMFPAETRALVGVNVGKIGASPLARRVVEWLLDSAPAQKQELTALLEVCAIDPAKDVDSVAIGVGAGPSEIAILAKGRFDEARLVPCLRQTMAKKGTEVAEKKIAGRTAYSAVDPVSGTAVWIVFGDGTGVVIATGEAWLGKVLDPAAPKASGNADTQSLIGRVGSDAAIWLAAYLTPEASQRVADVTKGAVKKGPPSLTAELALAETASLRVELDVAAPDDAMAMVDFARSQHIWLTLGAQKYGIGRIVNKLNFAAEGKVVAITLNLDQEEIEKLALALDKLAEK